MDKVLEIVKWILAVGPELIAALIAVLGALIAMFLIIPGPQPEKFLQGIADFLKKFSKK